MAFAKQLAFVPTLYSYLCTELQATTLLVLLGLPLYRVFSAHNSWYVYHYPGFHKLGAAQDEDSFMIWLARRVVVFEPLSSVV